MTRRRAALGALAAAALWAGARDAQAATASGAAFEFVALGDMPYGPDLIAGPAYRHLIDLINQAAPPFAIHVGDFKGGLASCADEVYAQQQRYFQRFASALVYTPGDNDWIDCQRRGDDPLQRLQALRARLFARPLSLGRRPIAVQRQADLMPAFSRYVENLRWQYPAQPAGVVFATFHTVGPDNAFDDPAPAVREEARSREAANAAWISAAFALARAQRARALVLATQAESLSYADLQRLHRGVVREGFAASISQTLLPLAAAAPFPVLLIHGDGHRYTVDQPFRDAAAQPIAQLWRLEVFGEPRMHAVRVRINAAVPGANATLPPFSFTPIWNPLSADPEQRRHDAG